MSETSAVSSYDDIIDTLDSLQVKAECLELMFDSAVHPLIVGDAERWHIVSSCFADALGYTRAELESMDWRDLVSDSQVVYTEEALSEAESVDGHVMTYEARDGSLVTVEWNWSSPDEHGRCVATGKFVG